MKELSIFVDESGDFGETDDKQSYYIVSFVFHDQGNDISEEVKHLEKSITQSGFRIEYIHTGPVIRREGIFEDYTIDERRQLIYKNIQFCNELPYLILYRCYKSKRSNG